MKDFSITIQEDNYIPILEKLTRYSEVCKNHIINQMEQDITDLIKTFTVSVTEYLEVEDKTFQYATSESYELLYDKYKEIMSELKKIWTYQD